MSTCRSCGTEILWAITMGGKQIPMDTEPAADGNFVALLCGREVQVRAAAKDDPPEVRYKSHFATCPNAGEHRKPRGT